MPNRAAILCKPFLVSRALCVFLVLLQWASGQETIDFESRIQPLLSQYCYDCHGEGAAEGGLAYDEYDSVDALVGNKKLWGKVWDNVLTETMPPADMPQLSAAERKLLSRWIARSIFDYDPANPDPGRVTIRRLNRYEYRYAVRDLLGIDFPVREHFPVDDTGYGFDTIGDVLTVSPPLIEKYFEAAEAIADQVVVQLTKKQTATYKKVYSNESPPTEQEAQIAFARKVIHRLATRAFRRPVDKVTYEKLMQLAEAALKQEQVSLEEAISRTTIAILVSPHFLLRAEYQPAAGSQSDVFPLDDYALAARLSFFLWSSIPDQTLFQLASEGRLHGELRSQVKRMLADAKADRFARSFVGQWLRTREVEGVHKEQELRETLGHLRPIMRRETEMFFAHVMRSDVDVMELITADYSFLDEQLAEYYGVPGVEGKRMRRVRFPEYHPRGGVLTHGSILLVTSNPDRSSPVKRGRFILDNILGTPSPPAPPDVPDLEEVTKGVSWHMSLREQLALHREDPVCASCHDRMDPLGLGLENFDAIGLWREDEDGFPIDASGELASGEKFTGIEQLREILGQKRRLFYRCLTRKLMIYALGRGIDYTDTPVVEEIVEKMLDEDASFLTLLLGIVESPQFQMQCVRNAEDAETQRAAKNGKN